MLRTPVCYKKRPLLYSKHTIKVSFKLIYVLSGLIGCYIADSKRDDEQHLTGMPV